VRLEDYQKKEFSDFIGLYDRGDDDSVPESHFSDCLNIDFEIGEVKTRPGLSTSITLGYGAGNGKVRRFANFLTSVGSITLILDDAGNLYTFSARSGDTATTIRLTVGGATDFSAVQLLGKIYIAFHDGKKGLSATNLKVYIPASSIASDEFRDAAGAAPSSGSQIGAADGAVGIVNAGRYEIAVAYITTSGYQTQPGPKIASVFSPTFYIAPGSKKITITSLPLGPSGTAKRQILITKANQQEFFFLASTFGGLVNDNTTTTATLDFDDTTDLVDSADYLFDLLETIPAPVGLLAFNGRLITFGENADPTIVRASLSGDTESFDAISGLVIVGKDDGFEIRSGLVIRNTLYINKELGIWAISDNDDTPSTWHPFSIDQSISIPSHGVASVFKIAGISLTRDWSLLADRSGILVLDGVVRKPPITHKVNDLWQRINSAQWHKVVIVIDERKHKVYCSFPLDSSSENNILLMGDYNLCQENIPDAANIKWAIWKIKPGGSEKGISDLGFTQLSTEYNPTLKIASAIGGGKIWLLDSTATLDDATAIESYWDSALLAFTTFGVSSFNALSGRITGSGELLFTISGFDGVVPTTLPIITLGTSPGRMELIRFDFQNERAKIRARLVSGNFSIGSVTIYGKPIYAMRPS